MRPSQTTSQGSTANNPTKKEDQGGSLRRPNTKKYPTQRYDPEKKNLKKGAPQWALSQTKKLQVASECRKINLTGGGTAMAASQISQKNTMEEQELRFFANTVLM